MPRKWQLWLKVKVKAKVKAKALPFHPCDNDLRRSSSCAAPPPMRLLIRSLLALTAAALLALVALLAFTWAPDRPVDTLTARWATPPSTFATINGLSVHLRDEGPRDDPEPVLLLHGTSASLHTWEGWVSALKTTRRVVTVDLPGFGLTGPNATGDYRSAAYVQFVLAVAEHLKLERFVLGGNSLGGDIAWQTAVQAPARVSRLVLVDAAGYPMASTSVPLGFRIARTPLLRDLMRVTLPRAMVASSVRNVYGDPARVSGELIDRYAELTLRAGNREALALRFAQSDFGAQAARIRELKMPTLILWGGQDRLIPPEHGQRFARDIAGSRLVVFDDLGHVPHEEDAARTVSVVQEFLGVATQ
jgi:pimeloyl-ACP methyl ester carboxylesterase